METINVSIFASAVRTKMWEQCLSSFLSTSVSFEVVFAGFCSPEEVKPFLDKYPFFKYIHTKNTKPSQAYEVSRRACVGETVVWFCDDGEVPNDVIGKAYAYWKEKNNDKLILSIQTKESGYGVPQGQLFDMNVHRFFGGNRRTPLMAPFCMMSRKFLDDIGGIDRRYLCGQYENDVVMRAINEGATVEIFGDKKTYIEVDHLGKSIAIGESTCQQDFIARPFATGYEHDRKILEASWTINGQLTIKDGKYVRNDAFEPFEDIDILTKSQSYKGKWE